MFPESHKEGILRKGHIELICGSMFSGKTEELIRRLKRAKIAKQKVEIFKPKIDVRYDDIKVVSHDANFIISKPVESSSQILSLADEIEVIGIDEAQFFDNGLPDVCNQLADRGIRIIVAGLDTDYLGNPFGCMPSLLAIAEYVTKVHAICMLCGDLAHYSHRIVKGSSQILLGEQDSYIPLCRTCFNRERLKKNE